MEVGVYPFSHGDPLLIDKIVNEFLSQGKFDKLRKECMSDADTKPAYQNLQQRVENTVSQFLKKQNWRPDLNKNQLRDSLRKHILESKFFDAGINRIVDQVVNPNVLATVFLPEVEEVVYNYLSIPRPSDKNQRKGPSDERTRYSGRDCDYKASQENDRFEKYGKEREDYRRSNHMGNEDYKDREVTDKKPPKDSDVFNEPIKKELSDEKERTEEKVKSEPDEEMQQMMTPVEKMEISSDESQESLSRMGVEGLKINELEGPAAPDSDDSAPLEINEKSMSESRESEDSIMNQMSPISQGRLTPDLEEELLEEKTMEKPEEKEKALEEKKPLTFVGRIPKIKREASDSLKSVKAKEENKELPKKEKFEIKNVYTSDESDSSKSYGKSDSDEKKRKNDKPNKDERRREDLEKTQKEKKKENSKSERRERSRDRHKDHKRERSRDRHKKSSSSSSSSQRERSSGRHKSSHRHKDSKSRRKEEEKKKSKSTDDHGKEKNKKEDRRSTDRDSNERERGRSSGSRTEGESRRKEKEQNKTEEGREESRQKEETGVEKEEEVVIESGTAPQQEIILEKTEPTEPKEVATIEDENSVLDFNDLFRCGAITRLEFPKLTDDFYVKFNSTGFRYFEEWEKTKLDCEEEFKEFVDEAENDLSLLSDDESEFEFEKSFTKENKKTISNLLNGLGNFRRSLMFDPESSSFYKWRNNKFYQKFRKKEEKEGREVSEKHESVESIKENIERGEKSRAMHLKLLNKYRRKAMRMGKPRRRQRRPESGGIKEKNENRSASEKKFFTGTRKTESFLESRVKKLTDCNLVESENSAVPDMSVNNLNNLCKNETVTLPESPEENQEWTHTQNTKDVKTDASDTRGPKLNQSLPLNLPPSPDSDDVNTNSGIGPKNLTVSRKRINRETEDDVTPKKQTKRNHSQKYESQDLYKPRPILNGSRTRGRERGIERDMVSLGSSDSR